MKGKLRLKELLERFDYEVELEKKVPCFSDMVKYDFRLDVYAENKDKGEAIGIEVDGTVGHHSSRAYRQDRVRDALIKNTYPIIKRIYRFPTKWLVGKTTKLIDEYFIDEMHLSMATAAAAASGSS